jgi:hypothetical protein
VKARKGEGKVRVRDQSSRVDNVKVGMQWFCRNVKTCNTFRKVRGSLARGRTCGVCGSVDVHPIESRHKHPTRGELKAQYDAEKQSRRTLADKILNPTVGDVLLFCKNRGGE